MKSSKYEFAMATDKGVVKPINEDRGLYKADLDHEGNTIAICAVADGMGGLAAGDIASGIAIQYLHQWWEERIPAIFTEEARLDSKRNSSRTINLKLSSKLPLFLEMVDSELTRVFHQINDTLIMEGEQRGKKIGTTLSVFFLYKDDYLIKHIGDSRIYQVNRHLEQLTEDHSWVAEQLRKGRLTPTEAKNHPSRHILTECLGVKERIEPYIYHSFFKGDETILVCSDGFYTMVEEFVWFNYLQTVKKKNHKLQIATETLVSMANNGGGLDNITVILVNANFQKKNWIRDIFRKINNHD
ncbi:hypothetical protein DP73_03770 [Desulfosporosinus sp. HMP52]|uniref:PP2C family protein-serine/threonine phosphatase n=1 Tax=Desulfosporosinus sp. HMP52 TaxID=1487923 RepID=UPI00051FB7A8|nr:protein phosphatase 2C domain-containing protein [Desulfosporosinus sp. HMP52]KGK91395.1 hypothetical protein DP73_03770 [Desulfosporosinus sp. HMP52]